MRLLRHVRLLRQIRYMYSSIETAPESAQNFRAIGPLFMEIIYAFKRIGGYKSLG